MKKLTLTLALLVAGTMAFASQTNQVQAKEKSKKDLFVLTTSKSMRGARVQVFHENGDLVAAQKLRRRKMIIDFCDVCDGKYTVVVVSNDGRTERFDYVKR